MQTRLRAACPVRAGAAYLFDGVQQAPVAVHHDHHRDHQAEDEETDDVGCGLSWLWGPAHWTARACTFYPITAPAQQRRHGPDQGINPRATNCQQSLAEIVAALVAQGESAVALVGQHCQRDQGHDACKETSNRNAYFCYFAPIRSKSQESRFFFGYMFEATVKTIFIILCVLILWSWLLCPSC